MLFSDTQLLLLIFFSWDSELLDISNQLIELQKSVWLTVLRVIAKDFTGSFQMRADALMKKWHG